MNQKKYQIFISSTFTDLIAERDGIIKSILELYHIPIGMEMFSAEDEDQWKIIQRTIESSDYYILILGLRYGSKAPDGISFTQKEYEFALSQGIPVLSFIMNENVAIQQIHRDNDLTEINRFRDTVKTNTKMAQFWDTKDQLITKVTLALTKQIAQKPGIGWVRGNTLIANENLAEEITIINKENRELREKLKELESKIRTKSPELELLIEPIEINADFDKFETEKAPKKIVYEEIDSHLKDFIDIATIQEYNDSLPTQEVIDKYNTDSEKFYLIENYSKPLVLQVSNTGTGKANNIYVDIDIPDGIIIYKKNESFDQPISPIPINPLLAAQRNYKKSIDTQQRAHLSTHESIFPRYNLRADVESLTNKMYNIQTPFNPDFWTNLADNEITIRVSELIHTRVSTFSDEYMIAPLKKGKHIIRYRIICEEYESRKTQEIEINI